MMNLFAAEVFSVSEKNPDDFSADANNNGQAKFEKYSLRPRSLRQKTEKGSELKKEISSQRNNRNVESGKPKQKPPPLSKYRRKTANARERNRMREINVAFETLRRAVPHISGSLHSGNEKLTKITTLRLAMKYIQALRQVLEGSSNHTAVPGLLSFADDDADLDVLLSDGESLAFHSDMSESFASPDPDPDPDPDPARDHPLSSPFSPLSHGANSPDICDDHDFPFQDDVISAGFRFDDDLFNDHCIGGLS